MISFEEVHNPKELSEIASEIWHEYWYNILLPEQIDYMLEKFQSEKAISEQIKMKTILIFIFYLTAKLQDIQD